MKLFYEPPVTELIRLQSMLETFCLSNGEVTGVSDPGGDSGWWYNPDPSDPYYD